MNIHEYQAKRLLKNYNLPVSNGILVEKNISADELSGLASDLFVVKAQIHAGGRGKGKFKEEKAGSLGGVRLAKTKEEAKLYIDQMLGSTLVTKQTGEEGKLVQKIYVEESTNIDKEFYFSMILDRERSGIMIVASTEGGMDIEDVAENNPEKIHNIFVNPVFGFMPFHGRKIANALELSGHAAKEMINVAANLYKAYVELDMAMLEINPLVLTKEGHIHILDAKVSFDENALYRQKDVLALRDKSEEDEYELKASEFGLSYIKLDGNIGCMVNGAGLAMATMDIIQYYGETPANFLDVGGGATKEKVVEAFKIINSDPMVKGILVNIFGGIMRCDIIANGIVEAVKEVGLDKPLVVRLEGTNVNEGMKILDNSGLKIESASDLGDAAQKVVAIIKNK